MGNICLFKQYMQQTRWARHNIRAQTQHERKQVIYSKISYFNSTKTFYKHHYLQNNEI
jgi:hypothetical protein